MKSSRTFVWSSSCHTAVLAGCKASRCRPARCGGAGRATRACWRCPARVPAPAPSATAPAWPPAPPTASPGCCCWPPSSCTPPTSSSSSPGEVVRRPEYLTQSQGFQDTLETMSAPAATPGTDTDGSHVTVCQHQPSLSTPPPALPPSPTLPGYLHFKTLAPTVMTPVRH